MLARQDRPHRDTRADVWISGRLYDNVDWQLRQDFCVLSRDWLAASDGVRSGCRRIGDHHILAAMPAEFERPNHALGADVGDDGVADALHQADLADGARAHTACADKADLDRPALLRPAIQCLLKHLSPAFDILNV